MAKRTKRTEKTQNLSQKAAETRAPEKSAAFAARGANQFLSRKSLWLIGAAVVLLAAIGAAWWWRANVFGVSAAKRTLRPVGNTTSCQKIPPFVQTQNFTKAAVLSTSERSRPGLWLIEKSANGEFQRYQNPSWKSAGFLAPIQRDGDGNVFVAPAPVINTLLNPIETQNTVYRVDGRTGEMNVLANLPATAPANEQNPFGTLALTFDCDTNSLYVSSVFGSSRQTQAGRIHRVNARTGTIATQPPSLDAFGIGVFNSVGGKRLYYGLARASEIWSIALDDNGDFYGEPRREISLVNLGPRGDDKARRISFTANREMLVYGIEFSFNLVAPTEKQETLYRFGYDMQNDRWQLLESGSTQAAPNQEIRITN